MKKFLVMAAMVLSSVGAFAQYEGGEFTIQPKVGLNVSSVTNLDNSKFKAGFVGGVEGEYHFSKLVGLSFGVLYSQEGVAVKDGPGEISINNKDVEAQLTNARTNLDYINVPILANIYVAKGLAVKAGIQPGFKVSGKSKCDYSAKIGSQTFSGSFDKDADGANSVNFSIPVGISYEYANICLDARYNIGVSHMVKDDSATGQVFQLTLGYKFKL